MRNYNASDLEVAAEDFRKRGKPELEALALREAARLRAQGDTSRAPTPFTLSDIASAAIHFEQIGNHKVAAHTRTIINEMVLKMGIRSLRRG